MRHHILISVLLFQDGDAWVAQGLEYDIAAFGRSIQEAATAFRQTFAAKVMLDLRRSRSPLQGLSPAPDRYWRMFNEAEDLDLSAAPVDLPKDVPPAYMLQAISHHHNHQTG